MIRKIKNFSGFRGLLSLMFVGSAGLISFASTRLVFIKFSEDGILSLGNALNIIGIGMVLSSLSIQSGLTRKLILLNESNYDSLKISLVTLYLLGIFLGLVYFAVSDVGISFTIILATLLYFPLSLVNSTLIAFAKQDLNAMVLMFVSASSLLGVYFANSTKEILHLIVSFQICFILVSIFPGYLVYQNNVVNKFGKKNVSKLDIIDRIHAQIDLLRFSFHSVSSGFQSNQAMLAARLFLVAFVGTEFAGEMEMYQRPLSWLFALGSSMSSLFFYPFVVKKIQMYILDPKDLNFKKDIFINVFKLGFIFTVTICVCFPILYRMTFGFDAQISYMLTTFWVAIFSLRFIGVLLSMILLAKNDVGAALIAEFILYLPLIIVFGFVDINILFGFDAKSIYMFVLLFSSIAYLVYFIYALRKNIFFGEKGRL